MTTTSPPSTPLIVPSILSADLLNLAAEVRDVEQAGADMHHIDVMDGHFVPNLTFGLELIRQLKTITTIPLDVHIMVTNPDEVAQLYLDAGAQCLTFHIEATAHAHRLVKMITARHLNAGVALNPATPVSSVFALLDELHHVLLMSVNPGFGGQDFIPYTTRKCSQLLAEINRRKLNHQVTIQVDGGVNPHTISSLYQAGARSFVAGSAVYNTPHRKSAITQLKACALATT